MMFNINTLQWDDEILSIPGYSKVHAARAASIQRGIRGDGEHSFAGPIKIAGAAGDQQAALFGQTCFQQVKPRAPMGQAVFCC